MFNREHDFVDPLPLVRVLRLPVNHLKTFKNVNNVVYAPSFHSQLARALVEVEHPSRLTSVETQEPSAQLSQALFFSAVLLQLLGATREIVVKIIFKL